jgi:hypothetical protein
LIFLNEFRPTAANGDFHYGREPMIYFQGHATIFHAMQPREKTAAPTSSLKNCSNYRIVTLARQMGQRKVFF